MGGMRWPASSTDAADARYRDSDLTVASKCASWTFVPVKNKLIVSQIVRFGPFIKTGPAVAGVFVCSRL